jgi:hypothetical protein
MHGTLLDGTRIDDKNQEASSTAPAPTARKTSMVFSDKLAFIDEPTFFMRTTSTRTAKWEEKEKPRHNDSGREL